MGMRIRRQSLTRARTYMGVTSYSCILCGGDDHEEGVEKIVHDPGCMLALRAATHVAVLHAAPDRVVFETVSPGCYSWRSGVSGEAYTISRCNEKRFVLVCSSTAAVVGAGRLKEIREFIKDNQGVL